jgi:hypothetical protein
LFANFLPTAKKRATRKVGEAKLLLAQIWPERLLLRSVGWASLQFSLIDLFSQRTKMTSFLLTLHFSLDFHAEIQGSWIRDWTILSNAKAATSHGMTDIAEFHQKETIDWINN